MKDVFQTARHFSHTPPSLSLSQSSLSSIDLDSPAVEERKEKDRGKEEPESVSRSVDASQRKGAPSISVRRRAASLYFFIPSSRGQHSTEFHVSDLHDTEDEA